MRKTAALIFPLLTLLSLFVAGCNQQAQTPEEREAAKYPPPSDMMSEEEGRKFMEGQAKSDPRQGGEIPKEGN